MKFRYRVEYGGVHAYEPNGIELDYRIREILARGAAPDQIIITVEWEKPPL